MKRHEWLKEVSDRDLPGYVLKLANYIYLKCINEPKTWVSNDVMRAELNFKDSQFSKAKKRLINEGLVDYPRFPSKEKPICIKIDQNVKAQFSSQEKSTESQFSSQETEFSSQETEFSSQEISSTAYKDEKKKKNKKKKRSVNAPSQKTPEPEMELPFFISRELWDRWDEYRKTGPKKQKWTIQAKKTCITRWTQFHNEGHNLEDLVFTAIDSGWDAVFPSRFKKPNKSQTSFLDEQWANLQAKKEHGTVRDECGATVSTSPGFESKRDQLPLLDEERRYYRN